MARVHTEGDAPRPIEGKHREEAVVPETAAMNASPIDGRAARHRRSEAVKKVKENVEAFQATGATAQGLLSSLPCFR